mmetsp:Transcript_13661/g.34352  ORF Transcript_13661/g.34352 Transcript_13661/m.34352 type:complete len:445 (-) Transcript_13661:68-1402(-)
MRALPLVTASSSVFSGALAVAMASTALAAGRGALPRRRAGLRSQLVVSRHAAKSFVSEAGEEFRYDTDDLLGEGAQGTVYRGTCASSGEAVAIKSVPVWRFILDDDGAEKVERIDREARKQKLLGDHPNIAKLFALVDVFRPGTTQHPQYKMLVMELVQGRELAEIIKSGGPLDEAMAKHVFRQVLEGVAHIHGMQHVHRDLKAENILVTGKDLSKESQVKIIDFGVTRKLAVGETFKTLAGTLSIRPPEIAKAKIAYLPDPSQRRLHTAKFKAPGVEFPGFGLVSRSPTGYGARLNGVEESTQASSQGLQDGWIITKLNGSDVENMLFQANPDDSSHAKVPKIVNMLMDLQTDFTLELVELPPREFSEKVDMWALGIVLYAMLVGKEAFKTDLEIIETEYDSAALERRSDAARSLVAGLLAKDPSQRLSLAECMAHSWLLSSS